MTSMSTVLEDDEDESLIGEGSDEDDLDQIEDHRWQPPTCGPDAQEPRPGISNLQTREVQGSRSQGS